MFPSSFQARGGAEADLLREAAARSPASPGLPAKGTKILFFAALRCAKRVTRDSVFHVLIFLAGGVACSSFGVQPQGSCECARNQLRGTKLMPCFESSGCGSLLILQVFPANALAVLLVIRLVSSVRTYLD